jgi:hypothetical protein
MRCSSARAREDLICAKRASPGTVVLDEAIDFDELGGDIAGATPSAGVAQPSTWGWRTRYELSRACLE